MTEQEKISYRYRLMKDNLNEKTRRLFAGSEAIVFGRGGVQIVEAATGVSHGTISKGKSELQNKDPIVTSERIRKEGGGRKKIIDQNPEIGVQLERELDGNTIGNPMSLLTRTVKSLSTLSSCILKSLQIKVGRDVIARTLKEKGYSLQMNKKMIEGATHKDRDEQFKFIATKSEDFLNQGLPVISIDTKKKELVGQFKNNGTTRQKKGEGTKVLTYDFPNNAKGKAVPYGIYDIQQNIGRVSVGISADTGEFAVASIRSWRENMGKEKYNEATKIYINADGGGSNSSRSKLRKYELQKFANEIQKEIHISHFPPGTSKRNKIEHRMFNHISKNRKGVPLDEFMTIVNLISNTKTEKGLMIKCALDENIYEKGRVIGPELMETLKIKTNDFHGERNYIILPKSI